MSIQFGIYDFFAYAVPGGLYLFSLIYILSVFTGTKFDFAVLSNLSIVSIVLIVIPAYIIGLVVDRIAVFWYRNFEPKQLAELVLEKFKKEHSNLEFKFQGKDWAILIAYLQREKPETTSEIHRFNAIHIMLKNASFNFVILAITSIVLFFLHKFEWVQLIIGISCIVASIISARQAVRFKRWSYSANFEAVIAKSLEQDDLIAKRSKTINTSKNDVAPNKPSSHKK
jgi:hypothetical protein